MAAATNAISEYAGAGGVTDTEAEELLKAARKFALEAEAWIKANYPALV